MRIFWIALLLPSFAIASEAPPSFQVFVQPAASCSCVRLSEQACKLQDPSGNRGVLVSCSYCERAGCSISEEE